MLAVGVAIWGGFRFRAGPLRLSLTSPARLLFGALALGLVRHVFAPASPIYRDLPRQIGEWRRAARSAGLVVDEPAPETVGTGRSPVRFLAGTALLFTIVIAVTTYPQVRHMGDAVYDPGDPLLNLWALEWVAHALATAPADLFHGNIFAPARYTL